MALFEVHAVTEHFLQVYNCKKLTAFHSVLRMKEHVEYEMHVQKKMEKVVKRGLDKVDEDDDDDNSSLPAFKKVKRYILESKVEPHLSSIAVREMSRKMSRKDRLSPDQGGARWLSGRASDSGVRG